MATVDPNGSARNSGRQSRSEESVSELVQQASQQLSQLVRDEMRLARAEMAQKGKRYGRGGGLFGGAGLFGVLTLQALAATAIAALSLTLDVWLAALIITALLAGITTVMAATGKKEIDKAGSPAPQETVDSVKADMNEIKERAKR
ncbi:MULTISPECIES: phage holin family protein [unclassified Streptomyces]|uniref:phage holin family protein n=1 Tax=unclassified Streptomyces TaxID=2593676 RepID=UPI001BE8D424|nr:MULTISPECIES: phage holin family protein [unclassified Streptomyces]MBT2404783.1 phage holin family protein [Streptomyces sp. ISL-21]MBT2455010.1 phage holin family protein [Streptomyces sp. ISL-86]MBT2609064.1 phage holin family protein [Streptomyces sp. ISL-87]